MDRLEPIQVSRCILAHGSAAARDHPRHRRHRLVHRGRATSCTSRSRPSAARSCCSKTSSARPSSTAVGRRVRITPAGAALLQLSHRVFQDLQDTVAAINDTQETLRGTIRLVGGMTVCLYVFPALLAEVRRIHPNLDLKVTVGSAERSIAMLRQGVGRPGPGDPAGRGQRPGVGARAHRRAAARHLPRPPAGQAAADHAGRPRTSRRSSCSRPGRSRGGWWTSSSPGRASSRTSSWRPRTWRSSRPWCAAALASASSRGRRPPPTSRRKQLACSRIAGHQLVPADGLALPEDEPPASHGERGDAGAGRAAAASSKPAVKARQLVRWSW